MCLAGFVNDDTISVHIIAQKLKMAKVETSQESAVRYEDGVV